MGITIVLGSQWGDEGKKDAGLSGSEIWEFSESWIMDAYPVLDMDMDIGIVIHAIECRC